MPGGELIDANILVNEGKIVGIARETLVEADSTYDARHCIALPGGVDVHVHFRDPSPNRAEDFESGTLAAAHGGVTTVADMPNTKPPVTNVRALRYKIEKIRNKAHVDYMLHGGSGATTVKNIREMARAGVSAIKVFTTARFADLSASDTKTIKDLMMEAKKSRISLMFHAEDLGATSGKPRKEPISHAVERSNICESVAVARILELARQIDHPVHLCHISCSESMDIITIYRNILGLKVTVETAPHYLALTVNDLVRLGPYAKVDPPLRSAADVRRLLSELANGNIDFVASDHAPYMREQKERGCEDIHLSPSGMPGIETTLPFLFSLYANKVITLRRLIQIFSTNASKFLGIFPQKGSMTLGSDADIVLVDPKTRFLVSKENLLTKTGQSMFEGTSFAGKPAATFLHGVLIMEDGKPTAKPGLGILIKRRKNHRSYVSMDGGSFE